MAGDERRLQILKVAMRLFSQRGFRGTTTKEIAQAAGVSEAMVFRHFATKKELYSAILDHKACLHDDLDPSQRRPRRFRRHGAGRAQSARSRSGISKAAASFRPGAA